MQKLCWVAGCDDPYYHLTRDHPCPLCETLGHGKIECPHPELISNLAQLTLEHKIPAEQWCTVPNCKEKSSHTTKGHRCTGCGKLHRDMRCPRLPVSYSIICPECQVVNLIASDQKPLLGIRDKCLLCETAPVQVYMPGCGHAKMCSRCFDVLAEPAPKPELPLDDRVEGLRIVHEIFGSFEGKIYTHITLGDALWFASRVSSSDDIVMWSIPRSRVKNEEIDLRLLGHRKIDHS